MRFPLILSASVLAATLALSGMASAQMMQQPGGGPNATPGGMTTGQSPDNDKMSMDKKMSKKKMSKKKMMKKDNM